MQHFEKLEPGRFYHIYNKGINGEDIFLESGHYLRFLHLYEKYIDRIADTYAWCLMKNHFHLLIKVKETKQIKPRKGPMRIKGLDADPNLISRQFGHLFNAYSQSFNKKTERTGGLFQTPFQRKPIETEDYFTTLIYYIHNNPVKHGICSRIQDYPWSSYGTIISFTPTKLPRNRIIGWFEGKSNFMAFHEGVRERIDITDLIFE